MNDIKAPEVCANYWGIRYMIIVLPLCIYVPILWLVAIPVTIAINIYALTHPQNELVQELYEGPYYKVGKYIVYAIIATGISMYLRSIAHY